MGHLARGARRGTSMGGGDYAGLRVGKTLTISSPGRNGRAPKGHGPSCGAMLWGLVKSDSGG